MSSQLIVIIDDSATHLKILERLARSLGRISAKTFVDADLALAFKEVGAAYELLPHGHGRRLPRLRR